MLNTYSSRTKFISYGSHISLFEAMRVSGMKNGGCKIDLGYYARLYNDRRGILFTLNIVLEYG